jgi:hypothetical protein
MRSPLGFARKDVDSVFLNNFNQYINIAIIFGGFYLIVKLLQWKIDK